LPYSDTHRLRQASKIIPHPQRQECDKVTTSQDDGFVAGLKYSWLGMQKARKIEKVTASQDDGFVGVLKKNIPSPAMIRNGSVKRLMV
jgi:hypothetical protein